MKAIPLRTALLIIAILAAWLAAIKGYAFDARIYRPRSLIKVDPTPRELYGPKTTNPPRLIDRVLGGAALSDSIARVLGAPAVAPLPSLKALPDPIAEVRRQLSARVIPDTTLIEVSMTWTSGPDAAAIVDAVVTDAIAAAPPDRLRRINFAMGGAPFRRPFSPVPCALITLAAALAILLLLAGPGLMNKVKATACPTCGRWGFRRVHPAA